MMMTLGAYGAVPYRMISGCERTGQIADNAAGKSWFLIAERSVKADTDRSI